MGTVKEQRAGCLSVAGVKPFHNGDGVCYLDGEGKLQGFRINRVEGNKLYPAGSIPRIAPRTPLFRNYDQEFERQLARPSPNVPSPLLGNWASIRTGSPSPPPMKTATACPCPSPTPKRPPARPSKTTCAQCCPSWAIRPSACGAKRTSASPCPATGSCPHRRWPNGAGKSSGG